MLINKCWPLCLARSDRCVRDGYGAASVNICLSPLGLHIVAAFPTIRFTPDVLAALEQARVRVYPLPGRGTRYVKGNHTDKIILGYGNTNEAQIEEGVVRIKAVLTNIPPERTKQAQSNL
ncbi:hypothetical protein P4V43_07360 [Brevibacillus fortis]|uniref:hypothetical protein n=1 Tax=Brevibacillus fortis TaxID=2126352 RepID=UPI002E20B2C7|nr:hypothetical protein [Brevibacillus fortis]